MGAVLQSQGAIEKGFQVAMQFLRSPPPPPGGVQPFTWL